MTLFVAWTREGQLFETGGRRFCYLSVTHAAWLSNIVLQRQCSSRKPLFVGARLLDTLQRSSRVLMSHTLVGAPGPIINQSALQLLNTRRCHSRSSLLRNPTSRDPAFASLRRAFPRDSRFDSRLPVGFVLADVVDGVAVEAPIVKAFLADRELASVALLQSASAC